jgi:hypothetical protein
MRYVTSKIMINTHNHDLLNYFDEVFWIFDDFCYTYYTRNRAIHLKTKKRTPRLQNISHLLNTNQEMDRSTQIHTHIQ